MLWVATAVVLVFAFFPHWIGFVLRPSTRGSAVAVELAWQEVRIEGMTCEGCAATREKAINQVPGVKQVHVSYKDGRATIGTEPSEELSREQVLGAIEKSGYRGELIEDAMKPAP